MSNDGLSTNEKVNLLFKNFMNFTSTLDSKQFYEETALANNTNIFSDNILSSLPPISPSYDSVTDITTISSLLENGISDISVNTTWYNDKTKNSSNQSIGTFQKEASNVILRMEKIKLDYVNNGGAAFVCIDNNGTNILQNIIPSNYASSGYSISLEYEKTSGVLKPIGWLATRSQLAANAYVGSSVDFGGALFDAKNGIITFYDVNGDPATVFGSAKFYFTATKYVGSKGAGSSGVLGDSVNVLETTTATHTADISSINGTVSDLSANVYDMSSNFGTRAISAVSDATDIVLGGTPTAPTATSSTDNTTQIATTEFVQSAISSSSQWTTVNTDDVTYTSGNVGIGITNPSYKLDVSGTSQFGDNVDVNGITFHNDGYSASNPIYYHSLSTGSLPTGWTKSASASVLPNSLRLYGSTNIVTDVINLSQHVFFTDDVASGNNTTITTSSRILLKVMGKSYMQDVASEQMRIELLDSTDNSVIDTIYREYTKSGNHDFNPIICDLKPYIKHGRSSFKINFVQPVVNGGFQDYFEFKQFTICKDDSSPWYKNSVYKQQVLGGLSIGTGDYIGRNLSSQELLVEGNVGIGTDSPSQALDVNGSARIANKLYATDLSAQTLSIHGDSSFNTDVRIMGNLILDGSFNGAGSAPKLTISTRTGTTNNIDFTDISAIRFDTDSGFAIDDLSNGEVKIKMNSTYKTWKVDGQTDLVAEGLDTMNFASDKHIDITTSTAGGNKTITFGVNHLDASFSEVQTTLDGKQDTLTFNAPSTNNANPSTSAQIKTALDLKANIASPTFTGTVVGITKAMVGLSNVDNTTDAGKPISDLTVTALAAKANLASPTFTGIPMAPTASSSNSTTQLATTAFVQARVTEIIGAAPEALDTLNELAAALGNSPDFSGTVTNSLSLKAPLASPTFTGNVSGITKAMVGLTNVDDTTDASKPISTAQQTALDLKANIASPTFTGTVVGITKAMVGLTNVDDTTDASKPISTAQQTALDLKANIASPTFTGTVTGITKAMVGLTNVDNTTDVLKPVSTAQQTALDLKANIASPTFTGNVSGITKAMVGLSNVDNTTDTSKPISTAQQTALDLKANIASPTFTGNVSGITKAMVGLTNVDNTTDALKPVSTAQQTALDLKANIASPTFTGNVSGITKAMVGLTNVDDTTDTSKPVSTAQQTALDLKANLAGPTFTGNVGIGSATPSVALDVVGAINATGNVNALNIGGLLTTVSQPNITTVGTLNSGAISNGFGSITSGGAITGTSLSAGSATGQITGKLVSANQSNITTVGTLNSGTITSGFGSITSSGAITGTSLSAGTANGEITGKLVSANQSNITSVGTLSDLTISATSDVTITTADSKNILLQPGGTGDGPEKVHIKGSLTVDGSINFTGGFVQTNTNVQITDQLDISNNGTGPALIARQHGTNNIADFYDDDTLAMRIANGGNVGIGITNPSYKLDVVGTMAVTSDVSFGTNLTVNDAYIGSGAYISQGYATFSHNSHKASTTNYAVLQDSDGRTIINSSSTKQIEFRNASSSTAANTMVFKGGKLGIGRTPTQALDVNGHIRIFKSGDAGDQGGLLVFDDTYGKPGPNKIRLHSGGYGFGVDGAMFKHLAGGIAHKWYYGASTSSNGTRGMHLESGSLGIGTDANTSYGLDVNGHINFSGDLYKNGAVYNPGSQWTTVNTNDITYTNTSGNVGIGMTNPAVKLDITSLYTCSGDDHTPAINTLTSNIFSKIVGESFTWITLQNKTHNINPLDGMNANELFDQLSINAINYNSGGSGQFGVNDRVKTGIGFSTRNLHNVNENALAIDYRGYVGIGITTPSVALDVSGNIKATTIEGTLTTAAQTAITSVGTLSGGSITSGFGSITSGGAITGTSLSAGSATGEITGKLTAASANQSNITTVGTLNSGAISNGFGSITSGGAITGTSLSAGSATGEITGKLTAASANQSNITSVGTLSDLTISATNDVTITTASNQNILLQPGGASDGNEKVHIKGDLTVDGSINFTGGFIQTNTNVQITDQLDISNNGTGPALIARQHGTNNIADFYDDNALAMRIANGGNVGIGTDSPSKTLDVGGTAVISKHIGDHTDSTHSVLKLNQEKVTSGHTRGKPILTLDWAAETDGTDSKKWSFGQGGTGVTNGGASSTLGLGYASSGTFGWGPQFYFTGDGRLGIGTNVPTHKLHVNGNFKATNIEGTLTTASQPNITTMAGLTSVGTLSGLSVTNPITGSVTGTAATVTDAAQTAITSVGTLSGLSVTNPIAGSVTGSAATVTDAAQTAITSVGTLTGLTVTADITGSVTGSAATVTTAAQPIITSVGTLTGLTVTADITGSVTGSAATVTDEAQPIITSVGTLNNLDVNATNDVTITTSLNKNILLQPGGASDGNEKVHIKGDLTVDGSINFTGGFIQTNTNVQITDQLDISNNGTGPALIARQHGTNNIADFYDDDTLAMRIANGGNVGIGITNPSYKLDVSGNIRINNGKTTVDEQGGKLLFDDAYNKAGPNKILLHSAGYGFGVDQFTLKYNSDKGHKFYVGSGATANGNLALQILDNTDVSMNGAKMHGDVTMNSGAYIAGASKMHGGAYITGDIGSMNGTKTPPGVYLGTLINGGSQYAMMQMVSNAGIGGWIDWTDNDGDDDFEGRIRYSRTDSTDHHKAGFNFYTNSLQRMVIDTAGNVGIGMTNPAVTLDVSGNIKATNIEGTLTTAAQTVITSVGTLSDLTISATNDVTITTALNKNILLQPGGASDGNEKVHIKGDLTVDGSINFTGGFIQTNTNVQITDQLDISNNGTGPALIARQHGTNNIADFYDDDTLAMRIANGGNVGIGITNPSYKLDVVGTMNVTNDVVFGTHLNVNDAYIGSGGGSDAIFSYSTKTNYANCALRQNSGGETVLNSGTNNKIWFRSNNSTDIMTLVGANVGIGITTPSEKLDVVGNIKATGNLKLNNSSGGDITMDFIRTYGESDRTDWQMKSSSGLFSFIANTAGGGTILQLGNQHNSTTGALAVGGTIDNAGPTLQVIGDASINSHLTVGGDLTATNIGGTLSTASQPNVTSVGILTQLEVANDSSFNADLYVAGDLTATNIITTGNVGIGMSNPAVTLDITSPNTFGSAHQPAINTLTGSKFSATQGDSFTWITLQNKADDSYPLSGFSANELFDQLSINAINYYNSSSGTGQYGYNGRVKTGMGFSTRNNTTVNENALAIDYRGYVGIGDTTPSFALDVSGTFRVQADGNDLIRVVKLHGSRSHIVMGSNIQVNGSPLRYTYNPYDTTTSWNSSQREIRTSSEADDITLNVGRIIVPIPQTDDLKPDFLWAALLNFNGANGGRNIAEGDIINIFCDESIAAAGAFLVYSDKRIKKDILTVDDDKALVDFRKLNPCTYSYIDTIGRGNKNVYGFIAQEVKEVLPHSCSTRTETVPNVYSIADISGNFLILQGGTFDNLEHDLTDSSGNVYENISIAIEGVNREKIYYSIKNIVNSTTIELYEELPSSLYIYNETTGNNQCFVFGQFVNNFNMLDKNAIWTVAAAATQEIDRQQQADKVRIAELETKVETLETQLVNVLARLTALESA